MRKEISILAVKNRYFGEIEHESPTHEMRDKYLPLLMLIVMKRNGDIKSRGVAHGDMRCYTLTRMELPLQHHIFIH